MNEILAENTYFTNRIETKHKIMVLKPANNIKNILINDFQYKHQFLRTRK